MIGNISGARAPDDPDETWCMKAAAITRVQTKLSDEAKPLKVAEFANQFSISGVRK